MRGMIGFLILLWSAQAVAQADVDALIAAPDAPAGVVFEIIEGEEDALGWVLPEVIRLSEQLRARFPALPVAVVTHGREQFGLLAARADGDLQPLHKEARGLGDADIDLHVCGVHASWYGHTPEDFPDYVDVSASGPAQINDYEALGYEVIRLTRDD